MTTLLIVHCLLCLALSYIAMKRHRLHRGDAANYRKLLPLIIVAAAAAIPLSVLLYQNWGIFFRYWSAPVDAFSKTVFVEMSLGFVFPILSLLPLIPRVGRNAAATGVLSLFSGLPPMVIFLVALGIAHQGERAADSSAKPAEASAPATAPSTK